MNRIIHIRYLSRKGHLRFLKTNRRKRKEIRRRNGFVDFTNLLRNRSKILGTDFNPPVYQRVKYLTVLGKKPEYNDILKFLVDKYSHFSTQKIPNIETGVINIPREFSLAENNEESMSFLKSLFSILHEQSVSTLYIDYGNCTYLDVDASACMDLILGSFINYFNQCDRKSRSLKIIAIRPINIVNEDVRNVLFSIGAYKNLKGFELKLQSDFIPFALRIGDSQYDKKGRLKEIHETQIVDYVLQCVSEMGRVLTADAESNLSKVVGEVMANAEEHSLFRYRFAIGYFLKPKDGNNHIGTFKLAIFNFGQTIYESFTRIENENTKVVQRMKELSEHYTKNGFFKKAQYEEQTLWTLYALQEGVTSTKDWKRGSGTIRFIDRFFRLKGDNNKDDLTKLIILSGNTRILFDGTYPLVEVVKGKNPKKFQMMTFNDSGNINEQPNNKFVTFVPQYFPGTLISAKICLTFNNLE